MTAEVEKQAGSISEIRNKLDALYGEMERQNSAMKEELSAIKGDIRRQAVLRLIISRYVKHACFQRPS